MRQITEPQPSENQLEFAVRPFREQGLPYIVLRIGDGYALFDPKEDKK
jgi:hypothetical protein